MSATGRCRCSHNFYEVRHFTHLGSISAAATFSLKEVRLPVRLVELSKSDAIDAFFEILDIFYVSNASFCLEVFRISDILDFFFSWNSPPSPVLVNSGLWAALGVGAYCW